MMVEGAILLGQDDDVLNIPNRAGAIVCGDGQRFSNVCFQCCQRSARAPGQLQEFTPID